MNIEVLQDYIYAFRREVVDSGFKRDLDDYLSSLAASQGNIVALREIAGKILSILDEIYASDLPDQLASLLPVGQSEPFTSMRHEDVLRKLVEDTEIQQLEFYDQLNQFIVRLKKQIQQNFTTIEEIEAFIDPYISKDYERIAKDSLAMLSIVFIERQTITSLAQFSKSLTAWNRTLPIYHQLLKSVPPVDVEIVEVQNGSIDCVINLDVDVALNLVDLFKLGFEVFAAYLSYKKMVKPIIDSYHGNKKLISQEEDRESLMLENIGMAINNRIQDQHKTAKKLNKEIDGTAIAKKVEQVTKLVTTHIVKGNDLKLLALPEMDGHMAAEAEWTESLRKQSVIARRHLREIPRDAQQKLLEAYGGLGDESHE